MHSDDIIIILFNTFLHEFVHKNAFSTYNSVGHTTGHSVTPLDNKVYQYAPVLYKVTLIISYSNSFKNSLK